MQRQKEQKKSLTFEITPLTPTSIYLPFNAKDTRIL